MVKDFRLYFKVICLMFGKNHYVPYIVENRLLSNKDGRRELRSYDNNSDRCLLEPRSQ